MLGRIIFEHNPRWLRFMGIWQPMARIKVQAYAEMAKDRLN